MRIIYFCSWWGLEDIPLEKKLNYIKRSGYDGVEIGIPLTISERERLKDLTKKFDLFVIAHEYKADCSNFKTYLQSFEKQLILASQFCPLLINSHSGKDYWNLEQNAKLIKIAQEIELSYEVPIVHETHRGRMLYSTSAFANYQNLFPKIKINADFSHWTCVSESLLEDQSEIVSQAIQRAEHIHARVGWMHGPQIQYPFDREWENELKTFTSWWLEIAKRFENERRSYMTITPEFGPIPYSFNIRGTNKPIVDFRERNIEMMNYLKKYFKSNGISADC